MKPGILQYFFLALFTLISTAKNEHSKLTHNSKIMNMTLEFFDDFLNKHFGGSIRVYAGTHEAPTREDIINKYKDQDIHSCFEGIRDFTNNIFEGYHK